MRPCGHPCRECAKPVYTSEMRELVGKVADYYELDPIRMTNMTYRDRLTTEARKAAAWMLCETYPSAGLDIIAPLLGYRDRSGVSHAVRVVEKKLQRGPTMRAVIEDLRKQVRAA